MRAPSQWHAWADIREAARSRLPRGFFEYIDRGSGDDHALRNNRDALTSIRLVPRVLRDVSQRRATAQLLGTERALPVVLAPTGPAGLVWFEGEVALARAAAAVGVPVAISTAATMGLELIRSGAQGDLWFQLYVGPDREASRALVDRAWNAGYSTLVVTVDSVVPVSRPFQARRAFAPNFRPTPGNLLDLALHPRWSLGVAARHMMAGRKMAPAHQPGALPWADQGRPRFARMAKDDSLNWSDLSQLRQQWPGKLLVKGVMHPDDAVLAVDAGVDGLIVSNHGGIALDCAQATIDALPAVARAVGSRTLVLVDGGIRHGSDIAKALALGAHGVMLGRLPLYALAAAGTPGVARALDILRAELLQTLAALGCTSVSELGPGHVAAFAPRH